MFDPGTKVKVSNLSNRLSIPFFDKFNGQIGTVVRFTNPYNVVSFGPTQADQMAFTDDELSLVTDV